MEDLVDYSNFPMKYDNISFIKYKVSQWNIIIFH